MRAKHALACVHDCALEQVLAAVELQARTTVLKDMRQDKPVMKMLQITPEQLQVAHFVSALVGLYDRCVHTSHRLFVT